MKLLYSCRSCGDTSLQNRRDESSMCRTCYNKNQKNFYSRIERNCSFSNELSYKWMRKTIRVNYENNVKVEE